MNLVQNSINVWQKTLNYRTFSNIRLGDGHIGRHLEYLKMINGDRSTLPQFVLNALSDWQPMKLDQTRHEEIPYVSPCVETGSGIVPSLENSIPVTITTRGAYTRVSEPVPAVEMPRVCQ